MAVRPRYQRSPRLLPHRPQGEVEIPAPPPLPARPGLSLVVVLLPVGMMALGLTLSLLAGRRGGATAPWLLYSLPMMLGSAALPLYQYVAQGRAYARAIHVREERYRSLLAARRQELEQKRQQQTAAELVTHPAPLQCLERAERLDARLWERAPSDADFLTLRLGTGRLPFGVPVKLPRQEVGEPDPLLEAAHHLADAFQSVYGLPVLLPLAQVGVAGLCGSRMAVVEAARSLAVQVAAHHAPDEVKLVALFPPDEVQEWAWLRWLPHTWAPDRRRRLLAGDRASAQRVLTYLYDLLSRRRAQGQGAALPSFVFILADPKLLGNQAILPLLLRDGPSLGALTLILTARREELPKECRAIATLGATGGELIETVPSPVPVAFEPDRAPVALAEAMARTLAPLLVQEGAHELPAAVPLLSLFGTEQIEALGALRRWQTARTDRSLAVPLGARLGGEPVLLDLHEQGHGPHGLVAGATGSGKSELLQALIAALAVCFHPHEVTFVLIDYKGGGMANAFLDLPHLVGTITNLQGSLAARALAALKGEMRRRQAALAAAGVNHVDAYLRLRRDQPDLAPLPHLILIADEFAELKLELPDFMRELVSAVRVGRSLGVHLILATQKPAGVVDEQIWSNARFRLCLRVERPEDSQEVLKRPDAATLTRAGRAFLQVGNNEQFELFQAAWGGAPYLPQQQAERRLAIAQVSLDGTRHPLWPPPSPATVQAPTQLQALVAHLAEVAAQAGIVRLPGPWLPPLGERVELLPLLDAAGGWNGESWQPGAAWMAPVIGFGDDPAHQRQGPVRLSLGKEGHVAVYGAPGTGKTTLLQTLLTALALAHSPQELHLYLLDFGGRTLSLFEPLPHVGAVILEEEGERLVRLLRLLQAEIHIRKERFAQAGVTTLIAYRATQRETIPAIMVVLDHYTALAQSYPEAEEALIRLAREGGNLGIHLVLTAGSPSAVRARMSSNITLAIALHLTDRGEYPQVVGRTHGLEPAPLPGRGLLRGAPPLELQVALPAPGETEVERSQALRSLIHQMAAAWQGPRPRPVPAVPAVISLRALLQAALTERPAPLPFGKPLGPVPSLPPAVPLGLETEDLEPLWVGLDAGPHFLIAGPPGSGKSNLLTMWLLALATLYSPAYLRLVLADFGGDLHPLKDLPHVRLYTAQDEELAQALEALVQEPRDGRPPTLIAIPDYDAFREGARETTRQHLESIVRRDRGGGLHLLMSGNVASLSAAWEGLVKALREARTGFLLGTQDPGDLQLFGLRLPPGEAGRAPQPGEGLFVHRGRVRKCKLATLADGDTPSTLIQQLGKRSVGMT